MYLASFPQCWHKARSASRLKHKECVHINVYCICCYFTCRIQKIYRCMFSIVSCLSWLPFRDLVSLKGLWSDGNAETVFLTKLGTKLENNRALTNAINTTD